MPWACLDDGWHDDPRTHEVSLAASGLYARATTYVARYLLDGVIPVKVVTGWLDGDTSPLDDLLRVGFLEKSGRDRYLLPDYLARGGRGGNRTKAEIEERRRERSESGRRGAERRHGNAANATNA